MNPYDAYMQAATKQAFIGAALQAVNQVVGLPGLASVAGGALKFIGRGFGSKAAPGALYRAGKAIQGTADRSDFAVGKFMNKTQMGGVQVPHVEYNLANAPGVVRHPARLIGMNVEGPQKLTPQRAAVWAGGALTMGQMGKEIGGAFKQPPQPQGVVSYGNDPMEIKQGAMAIAERDFAVLRRHFEEE